MPQTQNFTAVGCCGRYCRQEQLHHDINAVVTVQPLEAPAQQPGCRVLPPLHLQHAAGDAAGRCEDEAEILPGVALLQSHVQVCSHAALCDLLRNTTTAVFAGLIVMPLPRQYCAIALIRRCSPCAVVDIRTLSSAYMSADTHWPLLSCGPLPPSTD